MTAFTTSTLNYPQGSNTPIKRVKVERAPISTDTKNFIPGDEWLDSTSRDWWKLVDIFQGSALWVKIGGTSAAAETFTLDDSSIVGPDASNNINLLGGVGTQTSGNPGTNTITVSASADVATSYEADSGTAVPNLNTLHVVGAGGITTNATGSTVTVDTDGTVAIKFTADDLNTAIPIAGNLDIFGSNLASTTATAGTITVNSFAGADIIVSQTVGNGTHTTIQSAINDAVAGQTIWVKDGVYTENITTKARVNLCSFTSNNLEPQGTVKIIGKITAGGACVISGLQIETNGDYAIEVLDARSLYFVDCNIIGRDFAAMHLNNGGGNIFLYNCLGEIVGNIYAFYEAPAGDLWFYNCQLSGATTIQAISSVITATNTKFDFPITIDNAQGYFLDCLFTTGDINVTAVTISGLAPTCQFEGCSFDSGTAVCIDDVSGSNSLLNCSLTGNVAYPITGGSSITGSFEWLGTGTVAQLQKVLITDTSHQFESIINAVTADATPEDILITFAGINNSQMVTIYALVNGIKSDGSSALSCELIFGVKALAGVATIIGGAVVVKNIQKDFATADVSATVATNNAYITLTGEAATDISWSINVKQCYRQV